MKFEHLIEVNDPLNPLMDVLSIDQLWKGLVLRAESPKLFVPHLDECVIEGREEHSFQRSLRYGNLVVKDTVLLQPMHQVVFEVPAQDEIPASSLTMTIESPQPEVLWVRFRYEDSNDVSTDEANKMYDEFRRSAYQESDIDTIRIVRELAAEGRLGATLN